jgi:hypothetical protein
MNAYTAACVINVAIICAIAVACYATSSGFPLFALLFLMEVGRGSKSDDTAAHTTSQRGTE